MTAFRVLRPDEELDLKVEEEGLKRVVTEVLKGDASRVNTKIVVSDIVN